MSSQHIQKAIENFKYLIERSIIEDGVRGKEAAIRSSTPILNIHEAVKEKLIDIGVNRDLIFPPLGKRSPELKFAGLFKQKNQDVCVVSSMEKVKEILQEGITQDVVDEYGKDFTERTIAINIRSQISSAQKNFDTLYERTILEAMNLHNRCPNMVLGEVYMIAVPEYDDREIKNERVNFKRINQSTVTKYIRSFQAINNRKNTEIDFHKYEKVCLLIVDFSQTPVKIYNTNEELKQAGLIPNDSLVDISELSWDNLIPTLLAVYNERFTIDLTIS